MPANGIETRLFNIGRKQSGGRLQPELGARGSDSEDAKGRYDRDDCEGDDHLRDGEPLLMFGFAFHVTPLTSDTECSAGPEQTRLVHLWQELFREDL